MGTSIFFGEDVIGRCLFIGGLLISLFLIRFASHMLYSTDSTSTILCNFLKSKLDNFKVHLFYVVYILFIKKLGFVFGFCYVYINSIRVARHSFVAMQAVDTPRVLYYDIPFFFGTVTLCVRLQLHRKWHLLGGYGCWFWFHLFLVLDRYRYRDRIAIDLRQKFNCYLVKIYGAMVSSRVRRRYVRESPWRAYSL